MQDFNNIYFYRKLKIKRNGYEKIYIYDPDHWHDDSNDAVG
jgi:hypothetical protein